MNYTLAASLLVCTTLLSGCAAKPLKSEAANVRISTETPANCTALGVVVAGQGNVFTGPYTRNTTMEQGALNELRNAAAAMGGDVVQLLTQRAGNDANHMQSNVAMSGNVYRCGN